MINPLEKRETSTRHLPGSVKVAPEQLESESQKIIKSQISSTKIQINLKFQYLMSKTFPSNASFRRSQTSRDDAGGPKDNLNIGFEF